MSTDGSSYLESLWDAIACTLCNVIDAYGWILPALLVTALVLGVIAWIGCLVDDIPVDLDFFGGVSEIFKWARAKWGPQKPACILSHDCGGDSRGNYL